jgi:DnaK suppressor protein
VSIDASTPELRALLEEERDALRAQLTELGHGAVGLEYDSNFADSSQVTAERGESDALAKSLNDTLADVEHALKKFSDSTYGRCESCGQAIAPARLEAKPAARLCINCASKR